MIGEKYITRSYKICTDVFPGAPTPSGPRPRYRALTITLIHATLGRTPLDE